MSKPSVTKVTAIAAFALLSLTVTSHAEVAPHEAIPAPRALSAVLVPAQRDIVDQGRHSANFVRLAASTDEAAPTNPLSGTWQGTYRCGAVATSFALTLQANTGGQISGEFRFSIPHGGEASGRYRVRGSYSVSDGKFSLVPGDWIEHPSGWYAIALMVGTPQESSGRISGTFRGCGAGSNSFAADRTASSPASVQSAAAQGDSGATAAEPSKPTIAVTSNGAVVVAADTSVAPAGRPFEGRWTGSIACGQLNNRQPGNIPLTIDMLQDGDTVTAVTTMSTAYGQRREVMSGTADADGKLPLTRDVLLSRPDVFLKGISISLIGGGQANGTIDEMRAPPWHCAVLSAHRTGPPQVPTGPKLSSLIGTWTGFDFNVSRQQLDAPDPLGAPNSFNSQAKMVIAEKSGQFYGLYTWAYPADQPPANQDRLEVAIRPLLVTDDGRVAFAATAFKRAEGTFKKYDGATFLLVFASSPDGSLLVERVREQRHALRLTKASAAVAAAANVGGAPPVSVKRSSTDGYGRQ